MEYSRLVAVYDRLDATPSTLEKTEILADTFADAGGLLPELTRLVRGRLFAPWEPDDLGVSSSLTLRAVADATGVDDERVESWWRDTGDLGDAAARAVEERPQTTLVSNTLTVGGVYATLRELADHEGAGSQERRTTDVADVLADADPDEARYVVRTLVGAMRVGVGEGTVRDALASAFLDGSDDAVRAVERAHEVTNDFGVVAETARERGREGLDDLGIELFRPVKAMLARKADGVADALEAIEEPLVEYKYDGMRTQIHVDGDDVRVFTRRLEDVTAQFPDVAVGVRDETEVRNAIVEAEVVAYDPETGSSVPFQELSRRIERENDIEELVAECPVTVRVFDLLYRDGDELVDRPPSPSASTDSTDSSTPTGERSVGPNTAGRSRSTTRRRSTGRRSRRDRRG